MTLRISAIRQVSFSAGEKKKRATKDDGSSRAARELRSGRGYLAVLLKLALKV